MVGLIVVSHGELAQQMLRAVEAIVGPVAAARCHSISSGADLDEIHADMSASISEVSADGDGVIIMTDMFGGTPANVSARFLRKDVVEIVNGVNLPMLIKFVSSRDSMQLAVLADFLKKYGQKNIILTSDILCGIGN